MRTPRPPLLIYDGDCAFCRRWVARLRARTGDRVAYAPFQEPGLLARLDVPLETARRAVVWVEPDGARVAGAQAALRVVGQVPRLAPLARFGALPGVRALAELVYRFVSRHRGGLLGRLDRLVFGSPS